MRKPVIKNAFARYTNRAYKQSDPYDFCPICKEDIFWPEEEISYDENGQMVHAKCAEDEEAGKYES